MPEPKRIIKTWTTAMNHTAKYRTYGGEQDFYSLGSNMNKNDSSFWRSEYRDYSLKGVEVIFEKPVTITSFRGPCF